ncbi:universal stress protein family protein [Klebsormidium nitens]|uniref:Universal stress protein family protein n=1 Tax=Klebsormidium nitens TaxID=105231 RepID=A0A1Y1I1X5_KLENI|nr:universal stress protein family protein [Klebsormidium nitens]|eukprot:GAQ83962.1 universal stress protein family protein [Klebsormidium nitens]
MPSEPVKVSAVGSTMAEATFGGASSASAARPRREGAHGARTVLCAIDGSEHSHRAFHFALHKIICGPEDRVILFHALKPLNIFNHPVILNMTTEERAAVVRQSEAAARESLKVFQERAASTGVRTELVVVVGDPREQVSKYVSEHPVDMVVLGARGAADSSTPPHNNRFRLGSVSSHLVQHCPVPTVVVPEPRDTRALGG